MKNRIIHGSTSVPVKSEPAQTVHVVSKGQSSNSSKIPKKGDKFPSLKAAEFFWTNTVHLFTSSFSLKPGRILIGVLRRTWTTGCECNIESCNYFFKFCFFLISNCCSDIGASGEANIQQNQRVSGTEERV